MFFEDLKYYIENLFSDNAELLTWIFLFIILIIITIGLRRRSNYVDSSTKSNVNLLQRIIKPVEKFTEASRWNKIGIKNWSKKENFEPQYLHGKLFRRTDAYKKQQNML